MNPENTQKLFKDFPRLYRGKDLPISKNLMSFGFACGDGWFQIIYDLSKKITEIADSKNLSDEQYPLVVQVKEKFGGLRFYMDNALDEFGPALAEAEHRSSITCERDGKEGATLVQVDGWLVTWCPECIAEAKKQIEQESNKE